MWGLHLFQRNKGCNLASVHMQMLPPPRRQQRCAQRVRTYVLYESLRALAKWTIIPFFGKRCACMPGIDFCIQILRFRFMGTYKSFMKRRALREFLGCSEKNFSIGRKADSRSGAQRAQCSWKILLAAPSPTQTPPIDLVGSSSPAEKQQKDPEAPKPIKF